MAFRSRLLFAAIILAAGGTLVRSGGERIGEIPGFSASFDCLALAGYLAAGMILLGQAKVVEQAGRVVLGRSYLLLACIALGHLAAIISAPGVAPLLWNAWHAAFGLGLMLYAVSKPPPEPSRDNELRLWVLVAMFAAMVDFAFGTIAGTVYSIAWYGGRLLDLVTGLIVPIVLVRELLARFRLSVSANQELVSRSNTDGLTGLINRRAFDQELEVEIRRARREVTELSLLIVDLDHFKQVNDHFGHPMGDSHLVAVSQAMQLVVSRPADRVARFGGEEFAILLPRTGPPGAAHVAALVRQAIESLALPAAQSLCLTGSVGVATLGTGGDGSASDLIEAADRALYVAKRNGRNRVAVGAVAKAPVARVAATAAR